MARHRRGRSVDTDDKNLYPLLRVLKAEFGIDWGVYQEFLDSAKAAIKAGESYSAWTAQIELLIQTPTARMAHEGVLLLLKEMGVKSQRVLAQPRSAPPYKAADDDLAVWKKRLEVEHGVKGSQAQGNTKDLKTTEDLQRDKSLGDLRRSG
ncbi:hypothetical protein PtrM4_094020 [Pyrenophora tritici-repentis]|uniref:Uncharacterized protein n=1 Tax=Pyrenophora tritici-repentis TaxID=45151 RepID=A0A834RY33_9PLEO|nr:hypothetical protein PtrM4_094020 [Pyrenophora tritici-repentis]